MPSLNQQENFGIFTFFSNGEGCDYQRFNDLEEGQAFYREMKNVTAKLFIASGEVFRQKGDQVLIEVCTGKALAEGNLKKKTFDKNKLYVVNHESGTIYNDITRFNTNQVDEALKNFAQYPADDSTIIVRGSDGLLLKKKGNE